MAVAMRIKIISELPSRPGRKGNGSSPTVFHTPTYTYIIIKYKDNILGLLLIFKFYWS